MNGPPEYIDWPAVGCGVDGCVAEVWFLSRHPSAKSLPPLTVSCPVHGQVGVHTEPPTPAEAAEAAADITARSLLADWVLGPLRRAITGGTA